MPVLSSHTRAALQALFVTLLWSSSWVLIKIGLDDIPALTFAGLRYVLAWLCLLPLAWRSGQLGLLRRLDARQWRRLIALGLLVYSVTQGAQFVGLDRLPAMTVSLLFSFSPVTVALLGVALLDERLRAAQWGGIALYLLGAVIYFYPAELPEGERIGLAVMIVGILANALSSILGREVNREGSLPPLLVTVVSMGIGAWALLIGGVAVQGLPSMSAQSWAIVAWLAAVNSAFAFTLWNHTLRTLPAVESSLINNTMMIQIPILAWVFLGESLGAREIGGLALAALGTLIVQVRRARPPA